MISHYFYGIIVLSSSRSLSLFPYLKKDVFNGFCITLDIHFLWILRGERAKVFLLFRGVADVDTMPGACNVDKSRNSRDMLIVKCLGSRANIAKFNQGKMCGEKSSTSGISLWFTYLLSNKKPRYPFPGLHSRYMMHSVNNVCHPFLTHPIFSLLILATVHQASSAPLFSPFLRSRFFPGNLHSRLRLVHMLRWEKYVHIYKWAL